MSDKIKKLSQAIRLGATFRPQCQGEMFKNGKSCALGAAYEALTGETPNGEIVPLMFLVERFGVNDTILNHVHWRNDIRGMTREQISDWLETQGL